MLPGDQRAHLGGGIHPVADLHVRNPLLDRVDELIRRVADRNDHGNGHAALAGGAVAGAHGRVRRHVDVRVGQDDHVILGAAERLAPLVVSRRRLVDVLRDRRRADERDRDDVGMLEHGVDRDLVAVHDVEDTVWNARFLQELGDVVRRRWIFLRRLEDERVAARDRRRPHPHRHHRGEVERCDPADDTERLADRVDVDPGGSLLRVAALQQLGDPAAVLDHLEAAGDLAERVGEDLAVLCGEDPRDVLAVIVHELADLEEDRRLLRQRRRTPGGECGFGGLDREVDLLGAGEVDGAGLTTERGVVNRPASPRFPLDDAAADPVADPPDVLCLLDGWAR